jgi:hypothetical protein
MAGFKEAKNQLADFRKNADFTGVRTKVLGFSIGGLGKTAKIASVGVKFFGSALLNMIPFIGQAIFAIGLLSTAFNFLKNKMNPPIKSLEDLKAITETLPEKFEQLAAATSKAGISAGEIGIKTYKVTAGILQELASAANLARKETEDLADTQIKKINEARQRAGDLSGIAREALSPEEETNIRSKFERKATKQLQATLIQTFKDDSEESKLLRQEILKAANDLAKEGVGVAISATGETTANATLITKILNNASKSVADINGELTSLQKQVSDNERVFGRFFQKFEKKTEFDDSLASFEALNNTITKLNDAGKGDEVTKILEDMGAQAEKFGLTAENAADALPDLIKGFAELQSNAINLQNTLKKLDAGIKVAKQFEKLSVEGAARSLELQDERIQKEIDANQLQITTLEGLNVPEKKRTAIDAQIAGLQATILSLQTKQVSEAEQQVILQQTALSLKLKDLQTEQQIASLNATASQSSMKFRKAMQGFAQGELSIFKQQVVQAKENSKVQKAILETQRKQAVLELQRQIQAASFENFIGPLRKEDAEARKATIKRLEEEIRKTNELFVAKTNAADAPVQDLISDALVSDDIFVVTEAFNNLTDAQKGQSQASALTMSAFSMMGKGMSTVNGELGRSIGLIVSMVEQITNMGETIATLTDLLGGEDSPFKNIAADLAKGLVVANIANTALQAFGAAQQGLAQNRVQIIDQQIAAEKKLDGKSAGSVAKIKKMEAKKIEIQKKAFEQEKKMKIASAIINTATAITLVLAQAGIFAPPLAAMIGAMGAAQIGFD